MIDGDRMRGLDAVSPGLAELWLNTLTPKKSWAAEWDAELALDEAMEALTPEARAKVEAIHDECDSMLWSG